MKYFFLPFVAWFIAGTCKFFINCIRQRRIALDLIGYGGFPSTHTTVIASAVFLLGFEEGMDNPIFSFSLSVLLLFCIDAHGLRRKIGAHAEQLNRLQQNVKLRERMGHNWLEIFGGLVLGMAIAWGFYIL